jgi:pimeloyl-ACP methyl ester carboxylesterase
VAEQLALEFQVVAPDLPGFGESEKPPAHRFSYGVDTFAETILDLYAGLGLGRAAIVGQGLGGAVAINLAARHPELVSRLVLINALSYGPPQTFEQRVAMWPVVGGVVFKQLYNRAGFRAFFRRRMLSGSADSVERARIDRYYDLFSTPAGRGSALATLQATADTRSTVACVGRVSAPTLVIWGRRDRIQPAAFGQRLSREIRGAGFELLDAGHAPQEDRPEELSRLILGFLRDERSSRS